MLTKLSANVTERALWRRELERPEEAVDVLKVRADSEELVDNVLHAHNAVLAEGCINQSQSIKSK